jgi:hypothetical protein
MKKKLIVGGLIGAFASLVCFSFSNQLSLASTPRDCDNNAIIHCGTLSGSELKTQYNANKTGDLANIYNDSRYKISSSMINGQINMQIGRVYKDGRVMIGNEVVATNAYSIGRQNISGSQAIKIANKTYYERKTSISFRSDYITSFVFLDKYGKFISAIVSSCGNPVRATPKPKPYYVCTKLDVIGVTGQKYSRILKASSEISDATFLQYNYTIKDASGKVVKTIVQKRGEAAPTYSQIAPGSYSVEATVTVNNQGKVVSSPVGSCKSNFTIVAPSYTCDKLSADKIARNGQLDQINLTVKHSQSDATYVNTTYNISLNGKFLTNITSGGDSATLIPTSAGNYHIIATTNFKVDGSSKPATSPACAVDVTINPLPPVVNYSCDSISKVQLSRTQYKFNTSVTHENAAYLGSIYVVRDENGNEIARSARTTDSYTYSNETVGKYNVEALAMFNVDGKEVTAPSDKCKASFEITEQPVTPVYICDSLEKIKKSDTTYEFRVHASTAGNVQITGMSIDFGDGSTVPSGYDVSQTHVYKPGNYTAKAYVDFVVDGVAKKSVTSDNCATQITVPTPPAECKPGIPVGDSRCTAILSTTTTTTPPPAPLPATGPETLIGTTLGSGALGLGVHGWLSSRRALHSNALKRR